MRDFLAAPGAITKAFRFFFALLILGSAQSLYAIIQIETTVDPSTSKAFILDLRQKTGLASIGIDRNRQLTFRQDERRVAGSEIMFELITNAIRDPKNTFFIRDFSRADYIHFSETDQGTVDVETGKTAYEVKFDFEDFKRSRRYSSDEALGSFSFGINLFHEIDHKVSYDPSDPIPETGVRPDHGSRETRGVIERTNLVRRQLGLIPRDSKSHSGRRYKGIVGLFKNTFQILFKDDFGRRKFLRWKVGRRS
ncbi:MAG: hypothetical protein HKN25_09245 [Pyrinomonadaceae bacterium]|nr:hypothetical protein [Pyrinomonadaceae bacterium]